MATVLSRQLKASRRHLDVLAGSNCLKSPLGYIRQRSDALLAMSKAMMAAQERLINQRKNRFVSLTAKLDAMSPLKVLSRGYAMTQSEDGTVVRSVKQIKSGDSVNISLRDGQFCAEVRSVKENE